jgi:hypothetical protein
MEITTIDQLLHYPVAKIFSRIAFLKRAGGMFKRRMVTAFIIAPAVGVPFCHMLGKSPILYLLPYLLMLIFGVPYILRSVKNRQLTLQHYLMGGHLGAFIASLGIAVYFGITQNFAVGFLAIFIAYFVALVPCLVAAAITWKIVAADIVQ